MSPEHQKLQAILARYARPCWRPQLGEQECAQASAPVSRFGGQSALMLRGAEWPRHEDDGEPLALVLQIDTDELPAAPKSLLGGPGQIFQFFLPIDAIDDDARSFTFTEDDDVVFFFDVRITPKSSDLTEAPQPAYKDGATYPQIPPRAILGWHEQSDLPFGVEEDLLPPPHGYAAEDAAFIEEELTRIEGQGQQPPAMKDLLGETAADGNLDFDAWDDNLCEWGFKIAGHPALEQGPMVSHDVLHVLQFLGEKESPTGHEVAFDGHGWLCRTPEGEWFWYTVTS